MSDVKYIIFDIDDTLLSFADAFTYAQKSMADVLGIEYSDEYKALDEKNGWRGWKEMRLDDTDDPDIRKNYHEYYYEYVRRHYKYLLEDLKIDMEVEELVNRYLDLVTSSSVLMEECTLEVIQKLSEKYEIILASNGTVDMQTKRAEVFKTYVSRIYISEAMGVIKPMAEFFDYILDDLKCDAGSCLMVGDSIANDIIGAKKAGMKVCYYNPRGKEIDKDIECDHVISSISELNMFL